MSKKKERETRVTRVFLDMIVPKETSLEGVSIT